MASINKRKKLFVVFCVVLIYTFYTTFGKQKRIPQKSTGSKKQLLQRELDINTNWREDGYNFQTLRSPRLPLITKLHEQLDKEFPYEAEKGFQKNIWQTWKVGLEDGSFPNPYRTYQESWELTNPGYKHYVIADKQCDSMVNQLFENVPDVAEAWNSMPKSILKADFFRYLILYARGGVYSDIDTVVLKPIDEWASTNKTLYNMANNAGLVVGIEADPDRPDWSDWYARRIQFCQWTIQAKRGHPMLRDLIAKITTLTLERKKNNELSSVLGKDQGGDIMNWTGPGIFTDMVFSYINSIMQPESVLESQLSERPEPLEEIITWHSFTGIRVPIVIEDVLVLPITSFSPGVGQMGAGSVSHKLAYVQHLFSGSWKDDGPPKRERGSVKAGQPE